MKISCFEAPSSNGLIISFIVYVVVGGGKHFVEKFLFVLDVLIDRRESLAKLSLHYSYEF